ncbi:MAG: hypothetical protein ACTSRA_08400 [Promethearchaeota archaeon]
MSENTKIRENDNGSREEKDSKFGTADLEANGRLKDSRFSKNADKNLSARGFKFPIAKELDPFDKENLPLKGNPSRIRRFIRLLILWMLGFSLLACFIYSIFLAANFFQNFGYLDLQRKISYTISSFTLAGFLFLAIESETKDRKREIDRIIKEKERMMRKIGLTDEQVRLVSKEFQPPDRQGGKKFKIFFGLMAVGGLGLYGFFFFVFNERVHYLAMYGLVGAVIMIGLLLSRFAGELNVELWRFEIFGLHIHEAAVGIFFIIVSMPLMYNGAPIDRVLAAFYFFIGSFLIGRDWKDVASEKIIQRIPKKKDGKD